MLDQAQKNDRDYEQIISDLRTKNELLDARAASLRLAAIAAKVGYWSWHPPDHFHWDDTFYEITGLDAARHPPASETFIKFVHPEDRHLLEEGHREMLAGVVPKAKDTYRYSGPDGKNRWFEIHRTPVPGAPHRIVGLVQDITEKMRGDDALIQALASLDITLDGAEAAPWQYHTENGQVEWSSRGYEQLGLRVGEAPPSLNIFWSHTHPEDRPQLEGIRARENTAATGTKSSLQLRLIGVDGKLRWIDRRSIVGPTDAKGRRIFGVDIDITERKEAEQLVRESEERLRSLTANMPSAMVYQIVASSNGEERRFSFVAQNCEKLNGITAEAVISNPALLYDLILPDHLTRFIAEEKAALQTLRPFDCEVAMRRADGALRWYRISSAPRKSRTGDIIWDGVQVDITARVEAEIARASALAETDKIAAEREAVLSQLTEGVVVADEHGRITYVNQAAINLHGVGRLDVPVDEYSETYQLFTEGGDPYPPHDLPLARAVVQQEHVTDSHWRIHRPDGTMVVAVGSARPIYNRTGAFMGAVLTLRDDTARYASDTALRKSEAMKKAIFEASLDSIITATDNSEIVEWNAAAEKMFGYDSNTALGKNLAELIIPEELREKHFLGMARYIDSGIGPVIGRRVELEAIRAGGGRFPVELAISPIHLEGEIYFTAYLRDITARKQFEAAILDSEQRLRATYQHAFVGIAEVSPEGRFLRVNEEYTRISGYTILELIDRTFLDITHPDDREADQVLFHQQMSGNGQHYVLEKRYLHKHGHIAWIELGASRVDDVKGQPLYGIRVVRDITERKLAAEALQESEARLTLAGEAAKFGVYERLLSPERSVWSPSFWRLIGLNDDGKASVERLLSIVHAEDRNRVRLAMEEYTFKPGPYELEFRIVRADESYLWVIDRGESFGPINPTSGKTSKLTGTLIDITERKRAEDKIRILMREVDHRSKNLLAVVQAVANQTAATGDSFSFTKRFSQRLQGLAAIHDLLVHHEWRGVDLFDLVKSQLIHFQDLIGNRIMIDGPSIVISATAAQSLGMAIHELATNATKYGSLTSTEGKVKVHWTLTQYDESTLFQMHWVEIGGPRISTAPTHEGFGTKVTTDFVELALDGKVELHYASTGLHWKVDTKTLSIVEKL